MRRIILLILSELAEMTIIYFTVLYSIWHWFAPLTPDVSQAEKIIRKPYIRVLDKEGNNIATYGEFHGESVNIDKLPKHLIQALLDTEDRQFFDHTGFDVSSMFRALVTNLSHGRVAQGGSSLTQQLAKNIMIMHKRFPTNDQSLLRKIFELILALQLEKKYNKRQILTFYLNRVYFGAGTFGINAAAEKFFNKKAVELNIYEAARLVGMVQAPSRYTGNKKLADKRALQVLQNMFHEKHLSESDLNLAKLLALEPEFSPNKPLSVYFADWIVQQIPGWIFDEYEDITVQTTLDPKWQEIAEKHAKRIMETLGKEWEAESVALISTDHTGAVRAMIGGLDYRKSQFNTATQALRQPGSMFKILVYLTAIEQGYKPDSKVLDTPVEFGSWSPKNYLYKSSGAISLTTAFAKSVNTVSVRLTEYVKPRRVIDMAQRLLISSPMPNNLTLGLGTGELTMIESMTTALTIANEGELTPAYGIEKILDTRSQNLIFQHKETKGAIVLSGKTVNYILDLMEACTAWGSGRKANFGYPCAGKTGTSQNERDKWFMGFTANAVTCVRFSTNKLGMKYVQGKPLTTILWHDYMKELTEKMRWEIEEISAPDIDEEKSKAFDKQEFSQFVRDVANNQITSKDTKVEDTSSEEISLEYTGHSSKELEKQYKKQQSYSKSQSAHNTYEVIELESKKENIKDDENKKEIHTEEHTEEDADKITIPQSDMPESDNLENSIDETTNISPSTLALSVDDSNEDRNI